MISVDPKIDDLRQQINRLRRQIDHRLHTTKSRAEQLTDWRTYVGRYRGPLAMAALGAGFAVWMGFRRGRLGRWLGARLVNRSIDRLVNQVLQEAVRAWTRWRADAASSAGPEVEHG